MRYTTNQQLTDTRAKQKKYVWALRDLKGGHPICWATKLRRWWSEIRETPKNGRAHMSCCCSRSAIGRDDFTNELLSNTLTAQGGAKRRQEFLVIPQEALDFFFSVGRTGWRTHIIIGAGKKKKKKMRSICALYYQSIVPGWGGGFVVCAPKLLVYSSRQPNKRDTSSVFFFKQRNKKKKINKRRRRTSVWWPIEIYGSSRGVCRDEEVILISPFFFFSLELVSHQSMGHNGGKKVWTIISSRWPANCFALCRALDGSDEQRILPAQGFFWSSLKHFSVVG